MTAARRDRLLDCLADSCLPADLREWLEHGMQVNAAGGDLLEALELPGPDTDRRDDLLRTVILLSPGESITAKAAYFLSCLSGHQQHHREDMQGIVRSLRLVGCPRSIKQLKRITAGRRQDGWRIQEADTATGLCPSPVARFNIRTLHKTG